jgi:hypothetical protein
MLYRKLFPLRVMPLKRVDSDGGRDRKRLRRRLLQPMVGSKPTVGRHATGWELRWCRAFCEHHLK